MEHPSALESDYFLPTAKITVLINHITKMSKNPSIDNELCEVLDDFLQKLGECDKYLQNGIFNMNFAEAALLIQSSADVYSKKVDLLWDVIFDYQKRLLLSEEQNGDTNQELEKIEERKRKYKRKRKTNADQSETTKLINNFSFGNAENIDYLNQNYETVEVSKEWEKFRRTKQSGCDNLQGHALHRNSIFLPNNSVHSEDNDYLGRYDQFHSMSLTEEIFNLEAQKQLTNDYNCITRMRIDSYVINDFLLEKSLPSNVSIEKYSKELKEYVNNFYESHKLQEKSPSYHILEQTFCKSSYVCLERLPLNVMKDKLRRTSCADSLFDDDQMSSISETCATPSVEQINTEKHNEPLGQVGSTLENRSISCSQDSAFFEDMDDHDHGGIGELEAEQTNPVESINDSGVGNETLEVTTDPSETPEIITEETSDKEFESRDNNNNGKSNQSEVVVSVAKSESRRISKRLSNKLTVVTRQKVVRKWSSLLENSDDEVQEDKPIKRKKRVSEKALKKLATGVTVNYRDFELFCRLQYKAAEGEGIVRPQLSDSEDSDEEDNEDHVSEDEENDTISRIESEQELSEPEENDEELEQSAETDKGLEVSEKDSQNLPTITTIPAFDLPSCSTSDESLLATTSKPRHPEIEKNISITEVDFEQEEISRKNVREWRSFIVPKLKNLENGADFDIHEYGSKIIEPSEIGEQRYFKDIVKGKSAAEVARCFIATLQLANTYNVEIMGATSGKVANNSFQIKTLDKTKHHELLEDYQAPSEETFRERLERAKALNPHVPLHSTPGDYPPMKKMKMSTYSRKKLF